MTFAISNQITQPTPVAFEGKEGSTKSRKLTGVTHVEKYTLSRKDENDDGLTRKSTPLRLVAQSGPFLRPCLLK